MAAGRNTDYTGAPVIPAKDYRLALELGFTEDDIKACLDYVYNAAKDYEDDVPGARFRLLDLALAGLMRERGMV